MTGWILRDLEWHRPNTGWTQNNGKHVYLVIGPVPTRPPWKRWMLLEMNTGERITVADAQVRNRLMYKRLA